jgi:hypothetical protein
VGTRRKAQAQHYINEVLLHSFKSKISRADSLVSISDQATGWTMHG